MKFTSQCLLLVTLALALVVQGKRICYEEYGCFSDDTSLDLPWEPSRINTTFAVYNRANGKESQLVKNARESLVNFDCLKMKTVFVIHGFKLNARKPWINDLKKALLKAEDVNVIIVDWSNGNQYPYSQAAANSQIVGIDIAKLILSFMTEMNCEAKDFHLIGYSLGAHAAGNAGQRIPGLGRITALDPASIYFNEIDDTYRLDKGDALFVDVIHTDSSSTLGFGMKEPVGHVDFYPNGGKNQPGCASSNTKIIKAAWRMITEGSKEARSLFSCSHKASYRLLIDSLVSKCSYTAYSCANYKTFEQGRCLECPLNGCNQMGYWASKNRQLGSLYLNTKSTNAENVTSSFCKEHYKLRLVSNNLEGQQKAKGKFRVSLKTANHKSQEYVVGGKTLKLEPNMESTVLIDLDEAMIEDIEDVLVAYKRTSNYLVKYLYDQNWSFKYVELTHGPTQKMVKFCPLLQMIKSGTSVMFKKC